MLNPLAGGAERTIYEVGRRLVRAGNQVDLLTGGWPGASKHQIIDGIKIHRYGSMVIPHVVLPIYLKYHNDADLIIDDMAHAAPWFSPWFSNIPGVANFAHLHRRTISHEVGRLLFASLVRLERMYPFLYRDWPFITYSLSSKMDLVRLGVNGDKISVINPGVDIDIFRPSEKSPTPELVYFAGMKRYKRPDHALQAFSLLRESEKDAHLTMIGNGDMVIYLRNQVRKLNLNGSVTFVEKLDHSRLSQVLSKSWVNIHCSVSEGWGMTITEAASSGVPTAAYRVPGVEESVVDGSTGILVKDEDVFDLSQALGILIEKNREFSIRCRESVKGRSWDATADKWLLALRSAMIVT